MAKDRSVFEEHLSIVSASTYTPSARSCPYLGARFVIFFFLLVTPHGMPDLSFPAGDQSCTPEVKHRVLIAGSPGMSLRGHV